MAKNVAQKLIASHLTEGEVVPGRETGLRMDQTLTRDARERWSCWNSRRWPSVGAGGLSNAIRQRR